MKLNYTCSHKCHPDGLNVWVESCPVCGCVNPGYIEGAKCCFNCYEYPCTCGKNQNVNPFEDTMGLMDLFML